MDKTAGRRRRRKAEKEDSRATITASSTFTYIGSDRKYDYVRFGMGGQKGTWNQRGDESL